MAIQGKKSLLGEYQIVDTDNSANNKRFSGKNAKEDARAYASELKKYYKSLEKEEIFNPKTGKYDKVYQKDMPAYKTFIKTGKPVDITKIQKAITENQFEIDELEEKDKLSKQEEGILKLLQEQRKNLFHSAGQDTTGMSVPQVDADTGGGFFSNLFSPAPDDQLSESRWKAKKRKELSGQISRREIEIPKEYAGRSYDFRKDLVNAAWKAKMEKPAVSKEISEMTTQELKDFLDSYAQ